jgi:glycosyl hydrolase family 12
MKIAFMLDVLRARGLTVSSYARRWSVASMAVGAVWLLMASCSSGVLLQTVGADSGTGASSGVDATSSGGSSSGSAGSDSSVDTGALGKDAASATDGMARSSDGGCAAGTTLCAGACSNLASDPANCGACGKICLTGLVCQNSLCGCRAGQTSCAAGNCVDTTSDGKNCGACGTSCASGMVCSQSKCATGCAAQLVLCGSSCVDTTGNSQNCGACAHSCPPDQSCWMSGCRCPTGQGPCGTNMQCVDVTTSVQHCGTCPNVCAAGASCAAGQCACPAGQIVCGNTCIDPNTDPVNCGKCGTACTAAGTKCLFGGCIDPTSLNCGGGAMVGNKCMANDFTLMGKYWVNNNQWGVSGGMTTGQQCVWGTCQTGDLVGWGTSWNWTNGTGGVKTYASLVFGWQYGLKVTNTGLPVLISANRQVNCGWDFTVSQTGTIDVSYDTWLHTIDVSMAPNGGSNSTPSEEVMIWLYKNGAGPISQGTPVTGISLAGTTWDLYQGVTRWPVSSYVRTGNATTAVMNMMEFYSDLVSRGWIPNTRYLSSIQAGTEVFSGTGSLTTNGFYCRVQ